MSNQLKALHDRLMADKPDDAEHDPTLCVWCSAAEGDPKTKPQGGPDMGDFTQAQVDELIAAAVAEATKPLTDLQAKLAELEAANKDTEVGKAVAEAIAPLETSISELQAKLDAAEAAKTTAEAALADAETFWSTAIAEKVEADATEARKAERLAAAKDLGCFKDEYLDENADRFAAMSDDEFSARVEEWKLIASKDGKTPPATPPKTAFQASRQTNDDSQPGSALRLISEMRREGQDPRRTA